MAGFRIEGNTSSNVAEVDSTNNLKVNLPKDTATAGYAINMSQNDAGSWTGIPYVLSPETTEDYRLRMQLEAMMFSETFNYSSQDFGKWFHYLADSSAITYSGGDVTLNLVNTNANNGAMLKTSRVFPFLGTACTYLTFTSNYTQPIGSNNFLEIGYGIPATAIASATDGIFFRWTGAGVLEGVFLYNGAETITSPFDIPQINTNHSYIIAATQREVSFWIDDILQETLQVPATLGQPASQASLPVFLRNFNLANASTYVQTLKVSNVSVTIGGLGHNRTWSDIMAGAGYNSAQSYSGLTSSYTSNIINSTGINTASLSNTVPSYYHLGGDFIIPATNGSNTDYALFAFLNPAPSVTITSRVLVITGIVVNTYNNITAVATSPTVLSWQVGFGSTDSSLAVTDTSATAQKGARRFNLGTQTFTVGSLAGASSNEIDRRFTTPVVINPGEYLHIIVRIPSGTATSSETFCGSVAINGYWE